MKTMKIKGGGHPSKPTPPPEKPKIRC